MNLWNEATYQLFSHLHISSTLIAQSVRDPNILGQMQRAFTHFVQTGQAWAMLIGLAIGYMLRNLTSYG